MTRGKGLPSLVKKFVSHCLSKMRIVSIPNYDGRDASDDEEGSVMAISAWLWRPYD